MADLPEASGAVERELARAAHHRAAMVDRRAIGLKIVVGVVGFDLVLIKLAIEAASHVTDAQELAWIVRLIATGAFVVLGGMLYQLEVRSLQDRKVYWESERRAEAIRTGDDIAKVRFQETPWGNVKTAWASTWPLGGIFVLTAAIWVFAGLLRP
jgi:hypothetical protein